MCSKPAGNVLVQIVIADNPEQSLLAGVLGLLKTAALENPLLAGQLILVPADISAEQLAQCLQQEKGFTRDTLIRYQHGVRQILGWQEALPVPNRSPVAFKDHGVYLITGGLGSLGLLFAKEVIAQTRQAKVVLTGPLSPECRKAKPAGWIISISRAGELSPGRFGRSGSGNTTGKRHSQRA